jgi:hypothetical protein
MPPSVRGKSTPTIPTLAPFLSVTEEEDFSTLVGKSKNPISDLTKHPNSFWLHPQIFLAVAGPQSIRAAELATLVVLSIKESSLGDKEHPSEDKIGIYNLLVFLWAVEKRWTAPVIIQDPPDTQEAYTLATKWQGP